MKTIVKLLLFGLCCWLRSAGAADDYAQTTKVKVGDPAPAFACRTLAGEDFSLERAKGKVVLVNFFATWCGPCLAELPHLQKEIFEKYKDRPDFKLIVIGREHQAAELEKFQKAKNLTLPLAPDPKREIYGKYAEMYIPRNILISRDGKVKFSSVGYSEDEFKTLVKAVTTELERK